MIFLQKQLRDSGSFLSGLHISEFLAFTNMDEEMWVVKKTLEEEEDMDPKGHHMEQVLPLFRAGHMDKIECKRVRICP
jgi:hypothetical protein